MAGYVHIPWYATGFRGDALEHALGVISAASLRYGATDYRVYRYREDRYKFLQSVGFEDKLAFTRYWEGHEFTDFRVNCSGWFQVPVTYVWADVTASGGVALEPAQDANGERTRVG